MWHVELWLSAGCAHLAVLSNHLANTELLVYRVFVLLTWIRDISHPVDFMLSLNAGGNYRLCPTGLMHKVLLRHKCLFDCPCLEQHLCLSALRLIGICAQGQEKVAGFEIPHCDSSSIFDGLKLAGDHSISPVSVSAEYWELSGEYCEPTLKLRRWSATVFAQYAVTMLFHQYDLVAFIVQGRLELDVVLRWMAARSTHMHAHIHTPTSHFRLYATPLDAALVHSFIMTSAQDEVDRQLTVLTPDYRPVTAIKGDSILCKLVGTSAGHLSPLVTFMS